jgi:predicted nuclease with TOPRIM domain
MLPKSNQVPRSIAALRSLKLRKEAIANNGIPTNCHTSLNSSQLVQLQDQYAQLQRDAAKMKVDLETRHSENNELKATNHQLVARMEALADLPNQLKTLENRFDQMPDCTRTSLHCANTVGKA